MRGIPDIVVPGSGIATVNGPRTAEPPLTRLTLPAGAFATVLRTARFDDPSPLDIPFEVSLFVPLGYGTAGHLENREIVLDGGGCAPFSPYFHTLVDCAGDGLNGRGGIAIRLGLILSRTPGASATTTQSQTIAGLFPFRWVGDRNFVRTYPSNVPPFRFGAQVSGGGWTTGTARARRRIPAGTGTSTTFVMTTATGTRDTGRPGFAGDRLSLVTPYSLAMRKVEYSSSGFARLQIELVPEPGGLALRATAVAALLGLAVARARRRVGRSRRALTK